MKDHNDAPRTSVYSMTLFTKLGFCEGLLSYFKIRCSAIATIYGIASNT